MSRRRPVAGAERQRAMELAYAFRSSLPYCVIRMSTMHVYYSFMVRFPTGFSRQHLLRERTDVGGAPGPGPGRQPAGRGVVLLGVWDRLVRLRARQLPRGRGLLRLRAPGRKWQLTCNPRGRTIPAQVARSSMWFASFFCCWFRGESYNFFCTVLLSLCCA